ncbi:MAG: dihydrofolate reductase [Desulfobulbaceae bacterium]|nr:dihydrofolate reductase [Desulfobulbaceae bacterium]
MEIILMAAMAANRVIGRGSGIPWHNPEELRFFKETTMGHAVIMGKNTFSSLGRALPGRRNIVISRDPALAAPACETASSLAEALALAAGEKDHVFVIGGGRVFAEAIGLADGIIVSVFDENYEGDSVFPEIPASFQEISRVRHETAMPFTVFRYQRG